jgi:hypothetical protein
MFLVVIVRPLKNGHFITVWSEHPQYSRPQKLKVSPSRRTLHISIMKWHVFSCEDHRIDQCSIANVGSEVAHRVAPMLATVRRSNRACSFPAHGFHEDSCFRDAIEGIS